MSRPLRDQLWIVLAAVVVLFSNLGAAALWDEDEPLYASCAREMFQRGDWVVPTFNNDLFPEKPPLAYWTMMVGYALFGVTEFAARFFSAVFGVGTALLTYHLGRLLFRAEVGFWAGLIVVTSIIFTVSGRAATVDSALVFFTTAAMLCFVAGGLAKRCDAPADGSATESDRPEVAALVPRRWSVFLLFYACLGLAVLTKGPIGVLLPVAMIGLFLLIAQDLQRSDGIEPTPARRSWPRRLVGWLRIFRPRAVLRVAWQMRPLTAIVVVGAIALPWYVAVGLRTDGVFLSEFLGEQNLGRALKSLQGHSGPFFYYIPAIAIGFFPWSVFLAPMAVESARRIRRRHATRMATLFAVCWLLSFLAFWSIPSTKLPHYVLTAYPALALLTAVFADAWITNPASVGRGWIRSAMITYIVVGVAMIVALPIVAHYFLPGQGAIGLVGLTLVVGGALGLTFAERGLPARTMATCATAAVAFLTAMFAFAALGIDRFQNAPVVTAEIRKASLGPPHLAAYRFFRESLVFYAGEPVPRYDDADRLREFLRQTDNPYIVTTDEFEAEIQQRLPGELSVMLRRPRFLHRGELVVLARCVDGDAARIATRSEPNTQPRR